MPDAGGPGPASGRLTYAALRAYHPGVQMGRVLRFLPDHRCVYVKNPKVASSTVMLWLNRIQAGDPDYRPERLHGESLLPSPTEFGRRRAVRWLSGEAFRFTFVRDPARRLQSSYVDKIAGPPRSRDRAEAMRRFRRSAGLPDDLDVSVSFEEFLEAVEQQDPLTEMDRHWRPQHLNLMHPLVEYDHVGKVETFDADLAEISRRAGLPAVPVRASNVGRGVPSGGSVYDGRPDLLARVEALFATDMELYGY
jgi:hypothetical protein